MKRLIVKYKRKQRALSFLLLLVILNNTFFPTAALALTGGPSQPEVQSFEPIGTSELVDLFSGDFNYNLPLMDVDGYPINMSYHSGITMDQEASWVGLGWNINPGVVNRTMRGVPDDFNGEAIVKQNNLKDNITVGVNAGFGAALAGLEQLGLNVGLGINYNNYVGVGVEQSVSLTFNSGKSGKGPLSASLGLRSSNSDGLSVSPSVSFSSKMKSKSTKDQMGGSIGIGTSFNSRSGLKALSISGGVSTSKYLAPKRYATSGVGGYSSSIDFGVETFVPHVNIPMRNSSVMFQAQFGATVFSIDGTANVSGYYTKSKIEQKTQSLPSYGYFYEHNGQELDNVMLDFNREKDGGEFSVNTPGLPVTNHTYDIYNVSGQGVNGAYRLHRSDVGYVFDNSASSTSDSYDLGVEVASGNTAQVGVDITVTDVNTSSGKWTSDNGLANNKLKFKGSGTNKDYEPSYFKMAGEKVADPHGNASLYSIYNKNKQMRAELAVGSDKFDLNATGMFTESYDPYDPLFQQPSTNQNTNRIPRAQEISYLKVKESNFMLRPSDISPQVSSVQDNQFAEISVVQPDGKRYVYGKALYNTLQKEVSFNASGNAVECGRGLVNYSGSDNSLSNGKGADNYFASTEIPKYAHSYLITAVLSPDYVDIEQGTKVGPSSGDFGDYTLFEYQQNDALNQPFSGTSSLTTNKYSWRTPLNQNQANHNEGLRTKALDDQGNYVYGQKEMVYLKYIKTKNYVAVFELNDNDPNSPTYEPRLDGKGAVGENGGASSSSNDQSRFLKTITLYSRPDFEAKVANSSHVPFPIKQVHFVYDYLLCKGIYNGVGGAGAAADQKKLTLTKVYFTYGHSNKAKFSPYEFAYANLNYDGSIPANTSILNPDYNPKGYNKWGYYKPNSSTGCSYGDELTTSEYPYVEQDLQTDPNGNYLEDNYAAAWSLTKIKLPSGGEIKLKYESDDYAYVQNKQAMEMFKMYGVMSSSAFNTFANANVNPPSTNPIDMESRPFGLFDYGKDGTSGPSKGIVIKLKTSNRYNNVNSNLAFTNISTVDFKELYLKDLIDPNVPIYFREYVKVNGANNNGYEYVSGYAYVDETNVNVVNGYAFIPLITEELNLGSKLSAQPKANPLVLAALKFARTHTSREAFSVAGEPSPSASPSSIIGALADASFINTIIQTFQGPEKFLYENKNLGHHIIPGKSWIRLYNPYNDKLGGGSRIKNITITDNWNTMDNNEPVANYGQEYDYSTYTIINQTTVRISSGVATYEPMIGADDNPFRLPNFSGSKAAPLAPDTRFYLEEPYGESLFPSPSVGYARVRMKTIALDANGDPFSSPPASPSVTKHATGYTEHEFYTAKDYPVIVNRTDLGVKEAKSSLAGQLLKLDVKHYMTASQGFVVELNDMHGKPKANWVYAEGQGAPLSGVQYFYKDNGVAATANLPRIPGNKLMNDDVPVLTDDAQYITENTFVGLEYDMVADFREEETVTTAAGGQINLYVFYAGLPFLIPPIWPTYSKESTRLRTASFTKVINRYGILDETIAHQDGATIKTNNLLWDAETGEVLLTKTKNEFKDEIYSLNIPAHMGHKFMGAAYKNNLVEGDFDHITNTAILNYLVDGDELIVTVSGNQQKAYFFHDNSNNPIIATGPTDANILSSVSHLKVIRSGRRNMQNVSIGSVTFLRNNPLVNNLTTSSGNTYLDFNSFAPGNNILNANAVLFTDKTKIDCDCYDIPENPNPYYWGLKGNWHAKESYLFLSERKRTTPAGTTDPNDKGSTRHDGTYTTFSPFWKTGIGANQTLNPYTNGWTWTNSLSIYSVEGQELENRDALNRYSAATFGYNNKLPLSVSNNSLYREVGFDGFEDYSFDICPNPRFKFKKTDGTKANPDNSRSHSGKYSIKVSAGNKVELQKTLLNCTVTGTVAN